MRTLLTVALSAIGSFVALGVSELWAKGDWVVTFLHEDGTPKSGQGYTGAWLWSYDLSGSQGSFNGLAGVAGNPMNSDWAPTTVSTALRKIEGYQMPKYIGWLPDGKCGCRHVAPTDAIVTASGSGSVSASCRGDANNAKWDAGSVACLAYAKVTFSGIASGHCTADLNPSYTEGAATVSGTLKVSKSPPVPEASITISATVGADAFSTAPAVDSISVSKTSDPMNIIGQHLKGHGIVMVSAQITNDATSAIAEATTDISECTLTLDYGGSYDTCCDGAKPHEGHGEIFLPSL